MAVTITPVETGPYFKSWNITASADGDLSAQITHGFSVNYVATAPKFVFPFNPLHPQAYEKDWVLGVVDENYINLAASSVTGSGLAGTPQLQVIAQLPASIID